MKKILDALESLCRACPDVTGIGVDMIGQPERPHFTIKCRTEKAVYALAGTRRVERHHAEGFTWLAAYGDMTIYGPHLKAETPTTLDEAAVDAAIKQAERAVSP